jgi:AraC family transcriptional regulator
MRGGRWDGPGHVIVLALPAITLTDLFADLPGSSFFEFRPHPVTQDPVLRHLILVLYHELRTGCRSGRLFAESMVAMISVHALRRYAPNEPVIREYRSGLSNEHLRRVIDYIRSNLDRQLHVKELAQLSNMSPYYFGELFRQSTQTTVHRFVTRLRIQRAKTLLRNQRLSIADVGASVGLPNQSHFTELFRRHVGTTPRAYRLEFRPK